MRTFIAFVCLVNTGGATSKTSPVILKQATIKTNKIIMEIFKDIPNYEGLYQVSNEGRVKSLERKALVSCGGFRTVKEKILKPTHNGYGYLRVVLSKDGKLKTFQVHQLVAIAFLGHILCGYKIVCDHINNICTDNRVENLQLVTPRENSSKDRYRQTPSSQYLGVVWYKYTNKWLARIMLNGKNKHLGYFKSELEASKAYQKELKTLQNEKEEENQRIETVY